MGNVHKILMSQLIELSCFHMHIRSIIVNVASGLAAILIKALYVGSVTSCCLFLQLKKDHYQKIVHAWTWNLPRRLEPSILMVCISEYSCVICLTNPTTFPEKLYEDFISYTNTVFLLDSLTTNYVTNTRSKLDLSNFLDLKSVVQNSLPPYLSLFVHYPSLLASVIIVIVTIISLCHCVHGALNFYNQLKAIQNAQHYWTGM